MEVWKDIKGYEGTYQVSSYGRVRSKNGIRKPQRDKYGYYQIGLHKNGNRKFFKVHRLVAQAFIPNINNFPQINHKDEDKSNNKVNNLEWCTNKYNMNYGTRNEKAGNSISKKVICVTTGEKFSSAKKAGEKYNVDQSSIAKNCRNKLKTAGKHPVTGVKLVWRYYNES